MTSRLARYAAKWRGPQPPVAIAPEFLRPRQSAALRVQRRAFTGVGPAALATVPLHVWRAARWWSGEARSRLALVSDDGLSRFAGRTGVPIEVQRDRLRVLALRRGIAPLCAFRLGLLRDDVFERWDEYVCEGQVDWNAAAGGCRGRHHIRLLSDKHETAARLEAIGVPTVAAIEVGPLRAAARHAPGEGPAARPAARLEVAALAGGWLDIWPRVHGKRRVGSRGEGAFELSRSGATASERSSTLVHGAGCELRPYQQPAPVSDPVGWLVEALSQHAYLVQPRLTSHPMFAGIADPSDVVTMRVVTRDRRARHRAGRSPEVFSACLEVPRPVQEGRQWYIMCTVGADGLVAGSALPMWLEPVAGEERTARDEEVHRILADLVGVHIPDFPALLNACLRAHRLFPGVFAVAWDVALTADGFVFLEGNCGFGTTVPQWISGGLLGDLEA